MSAIQELPLASAMLAVKGTGMTLAEISALANVVSGLSALAGMTAPVPLSLIEEWRAQVDTIECNRKPPADKILRVYEDGMPG